MNGYGTFTISNGDKYEGEWKDGKQHGQETFIWGKGQFEGDKYEGEYNYDKRHGQGTYIWSNGEKFVGEWKDDKQWNGEHSDINGEISLKYVNGNYIKK